MNEKEKNAEVLKDRQDYRRTLIHRIETSKSTDRKAILTIKLKGVESQIRELRP